MIPAPASPAAPPEESKRERRTPKFMDAWLSRAGSALVEDNFLENAVMVSAKRCRLDLCCCNVNASRWEKAWVSASSLSNSFIMPCHRVPSCSRCGTWWVVLMNQQDSGVKKRPYFYSVFNLIDLTIVGLILALCSVHYLVWQLGAKVPWNTTDTFVDTFSLADMVRGKVCRRRKGLVHAACTRDSCDVASMGSGEQIYLMAVLVLLLWVKTLEYLRVNRNLSTFILIIFVRY